MTLKERVCSNCNKPLSRQPVFRYTCNKCGAKKNGMPAVMKEGGTFCYECYNGNIGYGWSVIIGLIWTGLLFFILNGIGWTHISVDSWQVVFIAWFSSIFIHSATRL